MKILCISDRVERLLYGPSLNTYASGVEAVVSCGDLPFVYLEYIITYLGVPVYYVLGNHDPAYDSKEYPGGCTPLDSQLADLGAVMPAGLSGSPLYSYGPNQYSERQMCRKARGLRPGSGAENFSATVSHSCSSLIRRPSPSGTGKTGRTSASSLSSA